jgi:hypothetical protein
VDIKVKYLDVLVMLRKRDKTNFYSKLLTNTVLKLHLLYAYAQSGNIQFTTPAKTYSKDCVSYLL